jgi:hypothetical protein
VTQALAQLLASRLAALPFLSPEDGARVTGLARLYTTTAAGDGAPTVRLPVPQEFTAADCERDSRYLVPNATTPAIFFFEDGGTTDYRIQGNLVGKESTLILLGWFNPARLSTPLSENHLVQALEIALGVRRRQAVGEYQNLYITSRQLPAETSLFARYSYDTNTPLLLPPFRLVGLELKCQFTPAPACPAADLPTILPATQCLSSSPTSLFTPRA